MAAPEQLLPEEPLPALPVEHKHPPIGKAVNNFKGYYKKYVNRNEDDPVFFGELHAPVLLKIERPHHRKVLELALQGFNITEISRLMGFGAGRVRVVLDQPWAKKFIVDRMREETENDFAELLKKEVLPSIEAVIEVRDSITTRPETKLSAANSIIDRVLGRAAQPIITAKLDPNKATDAELDAIIARASANVPTLNGLGTPISSNGEETTSSN